MHTYKLPILALLLFYSINASSMTDTVITLKLSNNTFGTLKMKSISGLEVPLNGPLILFNVGPGTQEFLDIPYSRPFTLDKSGWQPLRQKIAPVSLDLEYEVHGYRCRLKTRMEAPVRYGVLEPDYKPDWKITVVPSGSGQYQCNATISKRMTRPPFSYRVDFSISK
ncbi:hypothetical protein [Pseudomonas sp. NFX224]|uniref:hypothetical protein n=1 Tax=Pseudomonas sp. NFX224 TaxID=3402862 RepID=UPI003AFB1B10